MGFSLLRHHKHKFLHLGGISLLFVLVLGIFSAVWFRERVFFSDPAFNLFNIINSKNFLIQEMRYGTFITQVLALAGVYLKLPIHVLEIIYSLSFYLFYFLVIAWVTYRNRQPELALLFALYLCLMVSTSYFWPGNEIHQAVAWMILFLGGFMRMLDPGIKTNFLKYLFLLIIAALAISSHLLVIPIILFLWFFLWMSQASQAKRLHSGKWLSFTIILVLLIIGKIYTSHKMGYDLSKLELLKSKSFSQLMNSIYNAQSLSLLKSITKYYWLLIPIFLWGQFSLWKKKKFITSLYTIIAMVLLYASICAVYPVSVSHLSSYYYETIWQSFSLVLATPFVYYSLSNDWKDMTWQLTVIGLIFAIRFFYIYQSRAEFESRYDNLKQLSVKAQEWGTSKVLLKELEDSKSFLLNDWSLAAESFLMSKEIHDTIDRSYLIADKYVKSTQSVDSFNGCFQVKPLSALNPEYFKLDSLSSYVRYDSNWIEKSQMKKL